MLVMNGAARDAGSSTVVVTVVVTVTLVVADTVVLAPPTGWTHTS